MFDLFKRVRRKLDEAWFARAIGGVLATPPLRAADDGVIVFSMIGTRVLLPYLVAAKSFHAQLGRGRFAILDDGTLSDADKAVLAHHLDHPSITLIDAVDTGPCPRGGTWERLLTILDLRRDAFVIQLDSDIVVPGKLPEVLAAIDSGSSFTLRGEAGAQIMPQARAAHLARETARSGRQHVQSAIEQAMDRVQIGGREGLSYVRGCSGFAGFAPDSGGRALAEGFSQEAQRLLGAARWAQWGSEQVTSNFIIANEPVPVLLPYDRYMNYWGEPSLGQASLVHFLGTCRFERGMYRRAALAAIAALNRLG
jgi:hypothetical protein